MQLSLFKAAANAVEELVEAGFPKEVAERIASGDLPMDDASRMARAREQGFDTDTVYYHGTDKGDINEVTMDPPVRTNDGSYGFWVSDNPGTANTYATDYRRARVYPLLINKGKGESYDYGGGSWGNPPEGLPGKSTNDIARGAFNNREMDSVEFTDIVDVASSLPGEAPLARKYLKKVLEEEHGDGYIFNPKDATSADYGKAYTMARRELLGPSNNVVVRDPSQVRSPIAAFDPEYKGGNIMGGLLAGGVGLGALGQSDEADASVASLAARGLRLVEGKSPAATPSDNLFNIVDGQGGKIGGAEFYVTPDGDLSAYNMRLNPEHRGSGIMSEAYDAVEEITGRMIEPSDVLTDDGMKFWIRRDPSRMRELQQGGRFDHLEEDLFDSLFEEALRPKR